MTAYAEKLRDPRWQKMRLAVLARDEFVCTSCGNSESTVHVHHCYYDKAIEPWEYPLSSLITLCEYCHAEETPHGYEGKKALSHALAQKGIRDSTIGDFALAVKSCPPLREPEVWLDILAATISTAELAQQLDDNYFAYLASKRNGAAT